MRAVLKLSGEALAGDDKHGINHEVARSVAEQIKQLVERGHQIGIVIGGGNFWRGCTNDEIDRAYSDNLGMMATMMNSNYMAAVCQELGVKAQIYAPFSCGPFGNIFSISEARQKLSEGTVVFFEGGTGQPYFSTDTGVVVNALKVKADAILLAKAVDGVYDSDPKRNPDAKKFDEISIDDVIKHNLGVMDMSAVFMARDNKMPLLVFGLKGENSILNAIDGQFVGTKVTVG